MNKFDFELPQRPVHLVKCEECGRVFNVNDGDWHVYDVDLGFTFAVKNASMTASLCKRAMKLSKMY